MSQCTIYIKFWAFIKYTEIFSSFIVQKLTRPVFFQQIYYEIILTRPNRETPNKHIQFNPFKDIYFSNLYAKGELSMLLLVTAHNR